LRIDPEIEPTQRALLSERRERRDDTALRAALAELSGAAKGTGNMLYPMKSALECGATIGDITGTLVPVFGKYRP
jgi:methylmalonyl-CoA mutase N-terminal domain/subunit